MMIPVRLYDKPRDFAEMMARHLHSVLGLVVRPLAEEPLLLEVVYDPAAPDERSQISLHHTYGSGGCRFFKTKGGIYWGSWASYGSGSSRNGRLKGANVCSANSLEQ